MTWMADEAAYRVRERTRERADLRLDAFGAVVFRAARATTSYGRMDA